MSEFFSDITSSVYLHPNVQRTVGLIRPGSDGHLFKSTACERTSRKFVLINSGAAGQHRTFGIVTSEAHGHQDKIASHFYLYSHFYLSSHFCLSSMWSHAKAGSPNFHAELSPAYATLSSSPGRLSDDPC